MKNSLRNVVGISCVILASFMFISCNRAGKTDINIEKIEGTKLSETALLSNDNGVYNNFNIENGECKKVDSDEQIWAYDHKSDNYFGMQDDKFFAFCNGNKITLDSIRTSDEDFKISPGGKYLLFLRNEDGYKPMIINLEDGSEVKFDTKVLISGKLIDWIGDNKIAYYGINTDENQNGIFSYNLEDSSENIEYKFDYGDALFLKGYEDGVIFLQEQIDEGKFLKKIDINTKKVEVLSGKVIMVYDLVRKDNEVYIIGKIKDNNVSLYQITENSTRRMIYDFPKVINYDKGLSLDDEGNIIFIGSKDGSASEDIFKCTPRGDISMIKNPSDEYVFVK